MPTLSAQPQTLLSPATTIEVSIVIPCLNEAETIQTVITKALTSLRQANISGEVIVADNGSTDGSQALAEGCGARVVPVPQRGYGAALIGGINAALGTYVIMGDADDSYDFTAIQPFVEKLRAGYDLVMGTRMKGKILPGAMPPLHRWLGNPVLTAIGNILFRTRISDYHCGLRAFNRASIQTLGLRTSGMEFATEMVAKSALNHLTMTEIPITYYPDGRSRRPHLRTWRDGWRHLKFMLLLSPTWVFIQPGALITLIGVIGLALTLLTSPAAGDDPFQRSLSTQLLFSIAILIGTQIVIFGILSRLYASKMGLLRATPFWEQLADRMSLDTGLIVGSLVLLLGIVGIVSALSAANLSLLIVGLLVLVLGTKLVFLSFVVSLIRIKDYFG